MATIKTIKQLDHQPSPSADDHIEIQEESGDLSKRCTLEEAVGASRPRIITMAVVEETETGYVGRVAYGRGFTISKIELVSLAEDGEEQTIEFDLLAGLLADLGSSTGPASIVGSGGMEMNAESYVDVDLSGFNLTLTDDGYLDLHILDVHSEGASAIVRITGT